jgi:hypothetical protein
VIEPDAKAQPLLDRMMERNPDAPQILEVPLEDLKAGSIESCVKLLFMEGADSEHAQRLALLWGSLVLTFPLDSDPRPVTQIPEARRYLSLLHKAMPYFPCYLDFREPFGMFILYFGCISDPGALSPDGGSLDIMHDSVLVAVMESLLSIKGLADSLARDPVPILRAVVSCYPGSVRDDLIGSLDTGKP